MSTRSAFVLVPQDKLSDPTFRSFGRLVHELQANGLNVEARADSAASDDGRGFLLVLQGAPPSWILELAPAERAATLARVVLLGCVRPPLMYDELEKHSVAAGIDRMKLDVWEHKLSNDTGSGITGLRDVVARVGGKVAPAPFGSERYCTYGSLTAAKTTTAALAEYLKSVLMNRQARACTAAAASARCMARRNGARRRRRARARQPRDPATHRRRSREPTPALGSGLILKFVSDDSSASI